MFIIYDLIFLAFAIFYLPVYLSRKKFHRGFILRLGILPKNLEFNNPIWIHAVSVGEAIALRGFIEELRKTYPEKKLVISTVTSTGNKIARGIARETDFVTYFPFDFSFIVRHCIRRIKPCLAIIAETEIWPNFISCLHKNNIPVALINARFSDSSFKGYMSIKFLVKQILNKIDTFCAQTESDAHRLMRLGVAKERINVTGNMKFDASGPADSHKNSTDYRSKLGLGFKEKLFIAASTHPREEKIILNVYKKLLADFPNLRLLIAPRHPERANEIEKIAVKNSFIPIKVSQLASLSVSQLNRQTGRPAGRQTIFILDTVGQLMNYYAVCDIVFVGGSLIKKGGHNILEPASLAKPVIFGPHMFNFRDIAGLFVSHRAGILIHGEEELGLAVRDLLNNPQRIDALARAAKDLIAKNQGATPKNIECIRRFIC